MATLSHLVQTIAKIEGIDPATVSQFARNVREAGLITTRGRGTSAAMMGVTNAANLLIAVNASETARDAPKAVRSYRRLELLYGRAEQRRTFGDAFEQLIAATMNRALPERYLLNPLPLIIVQDFCKQQVAVEVTFHRPKPRAYLAISTIRDNKMSMDGAIGSFDDGFNILLDKATEIFFNFSPADETKTKKLWRPHDYHFDWIFHYSSRRRPFAGKMKKACGRRTDLSR